MTPEPVDTVVGRLFVDPRDRSLGKKLLKNGTYEPEWTAWFQAVVSPGMRVMDIGGNIGYFTVLFGTLVGADGRVVACEPDPDNRSLLTQNVEAHRLSGHVAVAGVAVADRTGTTWLHHDRRRAGVHSLSAANLVTPTGATQIEVEMLTLDDITARYKLDRVDLVKMDAQGAEALILRGASQTLAANRALTLLIEVWPEGLTNCGTSLDELLDPLERAGFVPHVMRKGEVALAAHTYDWVRRRASRLDTPQSAFNAVFVRKT